MRIFLLGSALVLGLGAPAFAGQQGSAKPIQVTGTNIVSVENAGGTTTTDVKVGNISLAASLTVKGSLTTGTSISVTAPAWNTP